ncbi:YheC/YheD family protein [Ureibacillus thermosphaericus]|uniref:YheC/YheD family protein n=1 Tax=Ureibacillus thermosphaericus TaxID=51173 RepID=UPI000BBC19E7|nr:YheC/YheD family protein [Ureibacillus thermosphaericus]
MLVGILKAYKTPTIIDRMAAMNVKELNGSAIFFNIHDVDFENEIIKCKRLVNGVWKSGYSEFPDVVYNDLPQTDATPYKLYRKLESKGIPFTTKRLGISKSEYQRLFDKGSVIQKHLIPTHHIQSAEEVLIYCEQYEKIALKPNYGHKGNGVKFIHTECDDNFTIYHHDKLKNTFNRINFINHSFSEV